MYDLTELKRCLISQQDNDRHDMTILSTKNKQNNF